MEVPDFTRAQYADPPPMPGTTTCDEPPYVSPTAFPRAILFGLFAALLGSLLYAVVGLWIQIGFVAILVGGMVGTGMMNATEGVGGRKYQVVALRAHLIFHYVGGVCWTSFGARAMRPAIAAQPCR